jgi:hypothetical protein
MRAAASPRTTPVLRPLAIAAATLAAASAVLPGACALLALASRIRPELAAAGCPATARDWFGVCVTGAMFGAPLGAFFVVPAIVLLSRARLVVAVPFVWFVATATTAIALVESRSVRADAAMLGAAVSASGALLVVRCLPLGIWTRAASLRSAPPSSARSAP